jgi:predicted Rossmann fold flavoprotein
LVIATGGLSIPKIGASDFGLRIAKQFGHEIQPPRPALVPLTFDADTWRPFGVLSGLSLEVNIHINEFKQAPCFSESLLFTHRGLSGPAILQISSFWHPGQFLSIDLTSNHALQESLDALKSKGSRRQLNNILTDFLPERLARTWLSAEGPCPQFSEMAQSTLPDVKKKNLEALMHSLSHWTLKPNGSEGWKKAEVMAGGVDTRELSSQTLESQRSPGLYFIGEVVDVTGWLGGYNFQWAWASAAACAEALRSERKREKRV